MLNLGNKSDYFKIFSEKNLKEPIVVNQFYSLFLIKNNFDGKEYSVKIYNSFDNFEDFWLFATKNYSQSLIKKENSLKILEIYAWSEKKNSLNLRIICEKVEKNFIKTIFPNNQLNCKLRNNFFLRLFDSFNNFEEEDQFKMEFNDFTLNNIVFSEDNILKLDSLLIFDKYLK